MRALFIGLFSGFWLGAIALSLWGLVYVLSHHPVAWDASGSHWTLEQDIWMFWFCACLGPLALLMLRLWKWIFTLCLIGLGHHQLHKFGTVMEVVSVAYIGHQLAQPPHHRGQAYWQWLTKAPASPGPISNPDRHLLRASFVTGLIVWLVSATQFYPQNHGQKQTVVTQHSEPIATQRTATEPSYSQEGPVIHSGCVDSTQNSGQKETEVRYAYAADQSIHQEPDGRWYPDETLSDINLAKQARASQKHHRRK